MASRTIRPRVMAAVWNLGTFTVPDLCQAAGLTDRNKAYAQIKRLTDEGFLDRQQLPSGGRHRGLTLYKLTMEDDKRENFAQQLLQYRPPQRIISSLALAEVSLTEALSALDKIDALLMQAQNNHLIINKEQILEDVAVLLESTEADIRTALLELDDNSEDKGNSSHLVKLARSRWLGAKAWYNGLQLGAIALKDLQTIVETTADAVGQFVLPRKSGGIRRQSVLSQDEARSLRRRIVSKYKFSKHKDHLPILDIKVTGVKNIKATGVKSKEFEATADVVIDKINKMLAESDMKSQSRSRQ